MNECICFKIIAYEKYTNVGTQRYALSYTILIKNVSIIKNIYRDLYDIEITTWSVFPGAVTNKFSTVYSTLIIIHIPTYQSSHSTFLVYP